MSGDAHQRLAIRPYSRDLEETVTLRNSRPALLRPIRPEDEPAHVTFISPLTPQDIRFRFFGFVRRFEHTQMARMTQIDYDREPTIIVVDNVINSSIEFFRRSVFLSNSTRNYPGWDMPAHVDNVEPSSLMNASCPYCGSMPGKLLQKKKIGI